MSVMLSLPAKIKILPTVAFLSITVLLSGCNIFGKSESLGGGAGVFQPGVPAGRDATNTAPVATDGTLTTNKNVAGSSTLTATDANSNSLTYSIVSNPSHGTVSVTNTATGAYTYTPTSNYSGADSFTFKANDATADSNTATISITVSNTATAPVAANITPAAFNEDTQSGVITLSYTDGDGDLATACALSALSGVTETLDCACDGSGVCTVKVTGTANTNGAASFSYTVTAGGEASNTASATLSITAVNDTPTLTTISTFAGATEDSAFTISYADLASAADEADVDGDALSFRIEAVSTGTLTKGGVAVTPGTTLLSSGESLVWTGAANASGTLNAFTVKVHDGTVASSSAVQVQVTVASANDAPTLTTISTLATATEDTAFTISYATLASAADEADTEGDTLSFRIEAVTTGTLTKGGVAVTAGTTLLSAGESLVWTGAANANGTLNAFTVKAHDGTSASSSAIQVEVTTTAVADTPTLTTISALTGATEDTAFTISYATLAAAADEADGDGDALSFRIEAVSTGTLTKGGVAVTPGTTLLSTGESLVWTPASNADGTLNAFTVKAHDGTTASSSAVQVQVTVATANDAPTLTTINTLATATEDTAFTIAYADLTGAGDEADSDGDAISFRVEAISTGSLTKGGVAVTPGSTLLSTGESLVWTGAANANGTLNAFTVKAHDGTTASSSAIQVQVTTTAANDAPTLTSVTTLTGATEDTDFTIAYADLTGAADEADVDGDAISFRVEAVSTGTLTKGGVAVTPGTTLISTGESLVWTPASNANGTLNAFTIKAHDGTTASSSAIQVQVTAATANDSPTLTTISTLATATEDTAFTISYATLAAAADEADTDGDTLSFRVEAVSTGTLTKGGVAVTPGTTLLSTGESLVWTGASNANGTLNAFTVKAHDGTTASSSAIQVQVTTTAAADTPTLTAISTLSGASVDTAFTISYATLAAAANEADGDGDALSFRVEAVSTGTLTKGGTPVTDGATLLSTGESLVWTPAAAATGTLNAFTVKAHDGALASSSAVQVQVSVALDFTDDDDTATGFSGGTKVGVSWNTNSINKLILGPDTDCDGNMSEGETVYTNCAELDESWTPQWSSLVAYWKMNEASWNGTASEVVDAKGTNHGVRMGDANTTSNSKIGSMAGAFDGVGDYVSVPNVAALHPTNNFTVATWVKSTANGTYQGIGGSLAYTGGAFTGYVLGKDTANKWVFWTAAAGVLNTTLASDLTYTDTNWHYILGVRNAGTNYLFIDGTQQTVTTSQSPGSSSDIFAIGRFYTDLVNYYYLTGAVDSIAIWNTPLTATEVQTIYSRQSAKYAGQFTSRVMNYGSSNAWDGLKWLTTLPFGKELTGDANNSGSITAADSETSTDYPSLVGSTGSTSDNNLMSGLVGIWHLNEATGTSGAASIIDKSGNGNHGSPTGGVTFGNLGKLDSAASFNGTSGYIEIGNSASLNNWTAQTISMWIKANSGMAGDTRLIEKGANNEWTIVFNPGGVGSTKLGVQVLGSSATLFTSTATIVDGGWHKIDITIAANRLITLYVDGVLDVSATSGQGPAATNGNINIGRYRGGGYFYGGMMDEVAIWNRALHADEIKQLYRRGANRIKHQVKSCIDAACNCSSYGGGGSTTDCDGDGILNASDTSDANKALWIGNDNTNGSYFSELHNYAPYNYDINNCSATNLILTGSPSLLFDCFTAALSSINGTSHQYFQYRSILESDDTSTNCDYGSGATWCSPELKSVEIKP